MLDAIVKPTLSAGIAPKLMSRVEDLQIDCSRNDSYRETLYSEVGLIATVN